MGCTWCPARKGSCCRVVSPNTALVLSQGRSWLDAGRQSLPHAVISLLPVDRLCSEGSGLYVGQAHRWLRQRHGVIKLNQDPPFSFHLTPSMPSPWHRAALALILEEKSIALGLRAHLSTASVCVSSSCTRTSPGAQRSLGVCDEESSVLGGGMGNMTQFMGFCQ